MTKAELEEALAAAQARIAELEAAGTAPVEVVARLEYPKAVYSKDYDHAHPERGGVRRVDSAEEEAALGDEWKDSPADFGIETHPSPSK